MDWGDVERAKSVDCGRQQKIAYKIAMMESCFGDLSSYGSTIEVYDAEVVTIADGGKERQPKVVAGFGKEPRVIGSSYDDLALDRRLLKACGEAKPDAVQHLEHCCGIRVYIYGEAIGIEPLDKIPRRTLQRVA